MTPILKIINEKFTDHFVNNSMYGKFQLILMTIQIVIFGVLMSRSIGAIIMCLMLMSEFSNFN